MLYKNSSHKCISSYEKKKRCFSEECCIRILLTSAFLLMRRKKDAFQKNIYSSLMNNNASVGTKNCFISILTRRQIFLLERIYLLPRRIDILSACRLNQLAHMDALESVYCFKLFGTVYCEFYPMFSTVLIRLTMYGVARS